MSFYDFFKKIVFRIDPELIHNLAINSFSCFPFMAKMWGQKWDNNKYQIDVGDLKWTFPVGLAAGMDENAKAISFFSRLGFGALEVGTVTPLAQKGNQPPRLWRIIEQESLRNRMGFNNLGSETIYQNVRKSNKHGKVIGVNLGKNKDTDESRAQDDYCTLYQRFAPICDYLVINVSSPNTPGLRNLQSTSGLINIFEALNDSRKENPKNLYLKIAPDLDYSEIDNIIEIAYDFELTGIIATNTTIIDKIGPGGISGKLLSARSKDIRKYILQSIGKSSQLEVIGVGGISSFDDLWEFWKLGGRAIQIYTAFVYQGPAILDHFKTEIDKVMEKNNLSSLGELLNNIEYVQR